MSTHCRAVSEAEGVELGRAFVSHFWLVNGLLRLLFLALRTWQVWTGDGDLAMESGEGGDY